LLLCDQGDLLNEVGSGVGQWVQQQAEELSKLQQGAADVLGGVVQKAGDSIKSGKLVSTAGSCMLLHAALRSVAAWQCSVESSGGGAIPYEKVNMTEEEAADGWKGCSSNCWLSGALLGVLVPCWGCWWTL
jgi:hypothetical protein